MVSDHVIFNKLFQRAQKELVMVGFSTVLLMLEENWRGPTAENDGIEKTLAHWQDIAGPSGDVSDNWRLELFLHSPFIDAFAKRKHTAEMQYETKAYEALRQAERDGVASAVNAALAAEADEAGGIRRASRGHCRWRARTGVETHECCKGLPGGRSVADEAAKQIRDYRFATKCCASPSSWLYLQGASTVPRGPAAARCSQADFRRIAHR